jgi:hypothetical protein
VIVCTPTDITPVLNAAAPEPPTEDVPNEPESLEQVIEPVGVPYEDDTVAVTVADCPNVAGFGTAATSKVVGAVTVTLIGVVGAQVFE